MAKKSASQVKPKAKVDVNKEIEEAFDEFKKGINAILDNEIRNAVRVDNLFVMFQTIRLDWKLDYLDDIKYPEGKAFGYAKDLCEMQKNTYKILKLKFNELKVEDLKAKDLPDPFLPLLRPIDEISTARSLIEDYIVFRCVRPFGERLEQMHAKIYELANAGK